MNTDTSRIVRLVEEVPGVVQHEAWFISRDGEGLLWQGSTEEAGRQWAASNRVGIDFVEYLSNDM